MGAVVFSSNSSILFLSSPSAFSKTKFGSFWSSDVPLKVKEITDGSLGFASSRDLHYPVVFSKQADGDSQGVSPQSSGHKRIPKGNEHKENQPSKNPEEIISLFRRIQSSISRGSASSKKRSPKTSDDEPSVESVLEVLRQSERKVEARSARKDADKISARQRGSSRKEQRVKFSSFAGTELTRPPSNFVRRSPIPPPNQRQPAGLTSRELPAATDDEKETKIPELKEVSLQKIEDMKLPELKELAKSRGIKGYSKLRKAELVKLLITV